MADGLAGFSINHKNAVFITQQCSFCLLAASRKRMYIRTEAKHLMSSSHYTSLAPILQSPTGLMILSTRAQDHRQIGGGSVPASQCWSGMCKLYKDDVSPTPPRFLALLNATSRDSWEKQQPTRVLGYDGHPSLTQNNGRNFCSYVEGGGREAIFVWLCCSSMPLEGSQGVSRIATGVLSSLKGPMTWELHFSLFLRVHI